MIKNKRILSVSELTLYLQNKIENDPRLSNLWLRGEVSNVKKTSSGHIFFTLKDDETILKCVVFRRYSSTLQFNLSDGMQVVVRGNLGIYERAGQYQLYVHEVQSDGKGTLYQAFERLKSKLSEEGLFDKRYKKKIPEFPKKIGVVTSKTAAVLKDILNIISRRCPGVKIVVAPVPVQGRDAHLKISEAVQSLNSNHELDVIIIARGGGSLEELWSFNTEEVARAIFLSEIPIITAVGHETDFTIADFVADLRAPTPSAAAELAVPNISDLEGKVANCSMRLHNTIYSLIKHHEEKVNYSNQRLVQSIINLIKNKERTFFSAVRILNSLNPLNVLERGYSICQKDNGIVIKDFKSVNVGEQVNVVLARGRLICYVKDREGCNEWLKKEKS